ncbi:hypothetical protein GJ744_007584 [Endocarpon pusillum]|uniref:Uncharacterized protein n=1 Tax=Endocarpon pusillum TaxID=364733 RepID=A0A8H7E684_9EURO|nr:hypothetical protein GJ744_007584 [Endocarpon pusillum]
MQSIERCTIKPWLSPAFIGVSIHQWRRLPSCLMILYNTSHPAARRPAKDELADRTEAWRQNSVQLRILHFYLLPSNKSYFIPFLLDSSLQRLYLKDDPPILQTLLDNAPNGLNGIHRLFSDHLKMHVRRGHISQTKLVTIKRLQAQVTTLPYQQRTECRWNMAYLQLHDLADDHAVPAPYYLTRNVDSQRELVQPTFVDIEGSSIPDHPHGGEMSDSLVKKVLEPSDSMLSPEIPLRDLRPPPSDFNWDEWLHPINFPSGCPSPMGDDVAAPMPGLPAPDSKSMKTFSPEVQRTCRVPKPFDSMREAGILGYKTKSAMCLLSSAIRHSFRSTAKA